MLIFKANQSALKSGQFSLYCNNEKKQTVGNSAETELIIQRQTRTETTHREMYSNIYQK